MLKEKKLAVALAVLTMGGSVTCFAASTLEGYNRARVADVNYAKLYGEQAMPEAKNDPELAGIMKKYIYGDLAQQVKLTNTQRQLITIAVLAAQQNQNMLPQVIEGAYNTQVTPLAMRETLYQLAPYIGFPKAFAALDIQNTILKKHGVKLPLAKQGTTTDTDRFQKGLNFQVSTYGERINTMRNTTPDYQKHLMDDLAAYCFGDTYTRGTLDYKTREMVTTAAIGASGTSNQQYKSHLAATLAAGATKEEVIGIITTMNPYIGFPRTLNCLRIANEVFAGKK